MTIRVPDDDFAPQGPVSIAVQAGRYKYPPGGLFGAGPGAKARFLINEQIGDPSGLTLCLAGDVIEFDSAGGGGYGDPLQRDPQAVEADVVNGYVSVEKAREDYGVVMEPTTLKVDLEETEKVRNLRLYNLETG
jgi:N-methylhydantoinase B